MRRHLQHHERQRRLESSSRGTPLRQRHRSAITLVELIATMILLGVVFTVSISMLLAAARQRRGTEQRQFAVQHAANLLERITTQTWSELLEGPQTLDPAPSDVEAMLPGLDRRIEVKKDQQAVESKLISVTVRWKDFAGRELAPVRLSTWIYAMERTPQ